VLGSAWLALSLLLSMPRSSAAIALQAGFIAENATPAATWDTPVAIAFLPDGRYLVAEKRGVVWMVTNGVKAATPLWSAENEVLNVNDRGLLDIAVHPDYLQNHLVYFLYTVDPDSNGVDNNDEAWGRLTRYQVGFTDSSTVLPSSRTILFGTTWSTGPLSASPSHTIGSVKFGNDGTLLVTTGDGANFDQVDAGGLDPNAFLPGRVAPAENIGAYRSQYIHSLAGKVLRLDPNTGLGLPSNPFYDGNGASVRSRVWAYGVRNSFRFTVRPGTGHPNPAMGKPGHIHIGEVSWYEREEFNVSRNGGENFGWPCYEGSVTTTQYRDLPQNQRRLCDSLGTGTNPASVFTFPLITHHHSAPSLSVPPGTIGNTSVGGTFYTGSQYPVAYQGRNFIADFGQGWIKAVSVDTMGVLDSMLDFATDADGPVDLETHPTTGDIFYVSIYTGEIRRIRFGGGGGGNSPPVVNATATPNIGVAPLLVNLSSTGTSDINGDTLLYSWDFGDGNGAPTPNTSHTYTVPGDYMVRLTVDDQHGGIGQDSVLVSVASISQFPTTSVLDDFERPSGALGGAWVGDATGLQIVAGQLTQISLTSSAVLSSPILGGDQEAWIDLAQVTPNAPEHNLMLKVQGLTWDTGHIEVRYDGQAGNVKVTTYSPAQGWVQRGGPFPTTLQNGDVFGARALANGLVLVFRNGVAIGSCSVSGWTFAAQGGRVGLTLTSASATRIESYGGGNYNPVVNTPPSANIQRADTTWVVAGDSLTLTCTASDAQQSAASLGYRWDIDLYHNNHVHPSVFVGTADTAHYEVEDHDDGTGVWFLLRLKVTDNGNLSAQDTVRFFPEIDLAPRGLAVVPASPAAGAASQASFFLTNDGRMPAHRSRWRLLLDGAPIAEADTVVEAGDSILVQVALPALTLGAHTLRAVADTLGAVVEPDEADNAAFLAFEAVNTAPLAAIDGPDPRWAAPGDSLKPTVTASDTQQSAASLAYRWTVDRLHLGVRDTSVFVSTLSNPGFVLPALTDSAEARYIVLVRVTDTQGLAAVDSVHVYPEADLEPRALALATTPVAGQASSLRFHLVNTGRAPAQSSRWRVLLDGALVAEGDEVVGRLDSVSVVADLPALTLGAHALRVVADSLGAVTEPDETDNAAMFVFAVANSGPAVEIAGSDTVWVAPGDSLALLAQAADLQQPDSTLAHLWRVDHHHGVLDTSVFVSTERQPVWVVPEFLDSLTTHFGVRVRVTDDQGASASDSLTAFAHIDLSPRGFAIWPLTPSDVVPIQVSFDLANDGRAPAPSSRWRVLLDGALAAEGDTLVGRGDSVRVTVMLPVQALGPHTLRVVVDTLGALHEPDETDNAAFLSFTVIEAVTGIDGRVGPLALSAPRPNPARGAVTLGLELPRAAEVGWGVTDIQGRVVWSEPSRTMPPGSWTLRWEGRDDSGAILPPGLYLARVRVGGEVLTRRLVTIR